MESLLNCQDNQNQAYDYESINESQQNLNILIQQQLFNNTESKVSQVTEQCEQELEMESLLNSFDHITKNNISKNVIKSFFSFLLNKNNTDQMIEFVQNGQTFKQQQILKKFKNYIQNYNYNNNSLQKLILHPVFVNQQQSLIFLNQIYTHINNNCNNKQQMLNQFQPTYQKLLSQSNNFFPTSPFLSNIEQERAYNFSQIENSQINIERKDLCESGFNLYESLLLKEEGFEMSDIVQKFDNISKNNISKNIIKAFFNYLLDIKKNDLLTDFVQKGIQPAQARKMAKNYFKCYIFNNNSLLRLIQHPKYGKAFEFYLTFEAEKWLANSKVQQKEFHLIYIDFLKLLCSNPEYSNHIIAYKKNKKIKQNE
ncbi:hypothetical protein ABPG74_015461 [Tetrahymena malaccensis]